MRSSFVYAIFFCFIFSQENNNPILSINVPSGVGIEVSGEVEVEFIDVEGKGGAQYRDEFIQKVDYRSPFVEIDKTVLDFKLLYTQDLTYNFSLRFDDDKAYADKHFLKYKKGNSTLEFGKNRPLIALKRKTEGYPLIGTAYWKGRQYHLDYQKEFSSFSFGASIALKRLIGYDAAAEDKSFEMMVYDDTEKIDGQTLEFGFRGETSFKPIKLQGWYYFGKLVDDEEWKARLHYDFDYYANIEDDQVLSDSAYVGHFWYGGRAEYALGKIFSRAEYIYSEDGFLPRHGYYLETSTSFDFLSFENIFVLFRLGELKIDPMRQTNSFLNPYRNNYDKSLLENDDEDNERFYPLLKDPQTWNRTMITFALGYDITSYAKLKLEYYVLDEETGDNTQPDVKDDQMLIQLKFNF
ncbi:hypothetical protein OA955_00645 [Candidatus Marinimicrobia bacterium]|nr:hypothetical protein [Candidatus Neomarinimicrobiota bacterium]